MPIPVRPIAWDRLFHAYGKATDTPGFLANLSPACTAQERQDAVAHLYSALLHQDTIWTATPVAVRVVAGMVRANNVGEDVLVMVVEWFADVLLAVEGMEMGGEEPSEEEMDEFLGGDESDDEMDFSLPVLDVLMRRAAQDVHDTAPVVVETILALDANVRARVAQPLREAVQALDGDAGELRDRAEAVLGELQGEQAQEQEQEQEQQ